MDRRSTKQFSRFFLAVAVVFFCVSTAVAIAATHVIYNSIPKPLPGNVASEGPEAYAFSELGDGLQLITSPGARLGKVKVVLSSWGCQTGRWYSSNCVTRPGATFDQAITINVYEAHFVGGVPVAGSLLGTATHTFDIPYRPSSDPSKCPADYAGLSRWYDAKDKACYHGLSVPIEVDFSDRHVAPLPHAVVVTVAFNSTHYGFHPIGESAPCYTSSGGCPYDALNISTDGNGGLIGAVMDPNSIFVNYTLSANACSPSTITGQLVLDVGCWTGFHPQIRVLSKGGDGDEEDDDKDTGR